MLNEVAAEQIEKIKGIESRMTISLSSLETHMNKYLFVMNSVVASVDRIIAKSKMILGENSLDTI